MWIAIRLGLQAAIKLFTLGAIPLSLPAYRAVADTLDETHRFCPVRQPNEAYRYIQTGLFSQGSRLSVGLSGPHGRAWLYPAHCAGPVQRCLHAEPRVQRVSGNPG